MYRVVVVTLPYDALVLLLSIPITPKMTNTSTKIEAATTKKHMRAPTEAASPCVSSELHRTQTLMHGSNNTRFSTNILRWNSPRVRELLWKYIPMDANPTIASMLNRTRHTQNSEGLIGIQAVSDKCEGRRDSPATARSKRNTRLTESHRTTTYSFVRHVSIPCILLLGHSTLRSGNRPPARPNILSTGLTTARETASWGKKQPVLPLSCSPARIKWIQRTHSK
jgi:hypothetical protein